MGRTDDIPLIEVHNLSVRIGAKDILCDVSATVREGEYLSIIGPNGAGKSTLLKCLDRVLPMGEDAIRLAGRPLAAYTQRELGRLMSYVPQSDGRLLPFTVHEFVLMGRYPHLSPFSSVSRADEDAVREALAVTGTADFIDRRLDTLSGGERQSVFIAAALAQGARILLLDEPTTFLDYRHRAEIEDLLRRLNRDGGVTIVSVTHDINSAAQWCHRILAIRQGRVAFFGPPDELLTNDVLESIYGRAFEFVAHPQSGRRIVVPWEAMA